MLISLFNLLVKFSNEMLHGACAMNINKVVCTEVFLLK